MGELVDIAKKTPGHLKLPGSCVCALNNFLDIYEQYFSPFKNKPINFLEIGVQKGGSLKIWKEYFPNAQVYGIDIKPDTKRFEEKRIHILIGNQEDSKFTTDLCNFDIIIDDGGHQQHEQINSLKLLWNHVNPKGLYIIEDICTAYWSAFGGGYGNPNTSISFVKNLIDNVNYMHAATDACWTYQEYLKIINDEKIKRTSPAKEEVPNINGTLDSIHFYEALAILVKK